MRETEQLLPSQDAALLMGAEACEANSPALGSDPFAEHDDFDPFLEGLRALGAESLPRPRVRGRTLRADPSELGVDALDPAEAFEPHAQRQPQLRRRDQVATPLHRRRRSHTPTLDEIELPDPSSWVDRLIAPEERRRLAALLHMVEGRGNPRTSARW